eukprot:633247-Pyramimonas_sp.AAC.1
MIAIDGDVTGDSLVARSEKRGYVYRNSARDTATSRRGITFCSCARNTSGLTRISSLHAVLRRAPHT